MNRKCSWALYMQSGLTKADVRLRLEIFSRVVKGVRVHVWELHSSIPCLRTSLSGSLTRSDSLVEGA